MQNGLCTWCARASATDAGRMHAAGLEAHASLAPAPVPPRAANDGARAVGAKHQGVAVGISLLGRDVHLFTGRLEVPSRGQYV